MTRYKTRKGIKRQEEYSRKICSDVSKYNKLKPFVVFRINNRFRVTKTCPTSAVTYLYDKKKVRYLLLTKEQRLNPDLHLKYRQFIKAKRKEIIKMINTEDRLEILLEADTLKEAREKLVYEEFTNLL